MLSALFSLVSSPGGSGDLDSITPTTTKGDLLVENGTNVVRLAVGTNGHALLADSGEASGVKWGAVAGSGDMLEATYDPASISEQLAGLTATQTLTNKTLTTPVISLTQSATPTPTAEGVIEWDTDGNNIAIGDGASTVTFSNDTTNAATYSPIAGSASIVTVGTVATGTWQGDVIDHERGGLEADVSAYAGLVHITGGTTSAKTIGIANTNIVQVDHASAADNDYAKFTANGLEGRSYAEVKTDLSLNNVENTAVSTWAGSANIVTVGTVGTGTWQGSVIDHERGGLEADVSAYAGLVHITAGATSAKTLGIADDNIVEMDDADAADNDYAKFTANGLEGRSYAEVKTDLSLSNVEDTAISTWAGSANIVTVGTVGTGTWQGSVIDHERGGLEADVSAYAGLVHITGGATSAKTIGIADDNIVEIDDADAADNDYAKFTANGLEGRSYSEVLADLSAQAGAAFSWNSQNLSAIGTVACNEITVADGHGINLQEDITFTGATTENLIKMPDNLADALSIQEGANKYITFDTTNGSEQIEIEKNMALGEVSLKLDEALSADGKWSGITCDGTLGATIAYGDLVYLANADDRWEQADADAVASAGDVMLGICLIGGNDASATEILLYGFVREDDWNFTSGGDALYVSTTAGDMTATAPTATGDVVRVVGYAHDNADTVFFNPSGSWVELA